MTNEKRLVAACLKSREANDKIFSVIQEDMLTPYSELVLKIVSDYYNNDKKAEQADLQYIEDVLRLRLDNPKKAELYVLHARECFAIDVSAINIANLLLEAKRKSAAGELAQALVNDNTKRHDLIEAIDSFKDLCSKQTLEEAEETSDNEILHNVPVEQINAEVLNKDGRIKLISKRFTEYIDGGALKGHHITFFGRPEIGKTAVALTATRSLCWQGLRGLYLGNEDPIRQLVERFQGCLSGIGKLDRLRDPGAANIVLSKNGYDCVRFISITPGSVDEVDKYAEEFLPDWIIVDQMRNFGSRAENRTNQLEAIATGLRTVAKKRSLLMIDFTQAGDSATNKLVLDQGDIDGSNTGIPAQADLLVGIGGNKEFEDHGLRMISFPKNKLSGQHVHFEMKINPLLSTMEDL